MKIRRNEQVVSFGELKEGDVFKRGTVYCIKTETVTQSGANRNAVNLEFGNHMAFMDGEHVIPVNGAFVEVYGEEDSAHD